MDEPEPIDWSKSDALTEEMRARLHAQEPITAGAGLGMNQRTIENLGDPSGAREEFTGNAVTFDVWENGALVTYDVPASNRVVLGTIPP